LATIQDYLDWRGDLTFASSEFNEVDSYILAKIGTTELDGFVPEGPEPVPLLWAVRQYFESRDKKSKLGVIVSQNIEPVVKRLPDTVRFRDLELFGFVNRVLPEIVEQFSAMTIRLPDGTNYVSYRATDDSIAAWKENFTMSISRIVPAQQDAAEYLQQIADVTRGPLILGGHSKGGNLAVYAAAVAPKEIQDRIIAVYNFDGPGFHEDFLEQEGYQRIRDRVMDFVPERAIVGTLLFSDAETNVIRCPSAQPCHDGFTWAVKGPQFVRADGLTKPSEAFDKTMETLVREMTVEEKTKLVREVFAILENTGCQTLTDLTEHTIRQAFQMAKNYQKSEEMQRFVSMFAENMFYNLVPVPKNITDILPPTIQEKLPAKKTEEEKAAKKSAKKNAKKSGGKSKKKGSKKDPES